MPFYFPFKAQRQKENDGKCLRPADTAAFNHGIITPNYSTILLLIVGNMFPDVDLILPSKKKNNNVPATIADIMNLLESKIVLYSINYLFF